MDYINNSSSLTKLTHQSEALVETTNDFLNKFLFSYKFLLDEYSRIF